MLPFPPPLPLPPYPHPCHPPPPKVCTLAERYAPDTTWFIGTMAEVRGAGLGGRGEETGWGRGEGGGNGGGRQWWGERDGKHSGRGRESWGAGAMSEASIVQNRRGEGWVYPPPILPRHASPPPGCLSLGMTPSPTSEAQHLVNFTSKQEERM